MNTQYGLADLAAASGQQGAPAPGGMGGAPPTAANPGGLGPTHDPLAKGIETGVMVLEQLAQEAKFVDASFSAQVAMMAAKLQQTKAKRQQQIESALESAQVLQGAGQVAMPNMDRPVSQPPAAPGGGAFDPRMS